MTKLLPVLLLGAALAGCSRQEPEAPAPENVAAPRPSPPAASPSPVATPSPTPSATPTPADPLPPPAEVGADEQMFDDASATGMTARVQREEEDAPEPPPGDSEVP